MNACTTGSYCVGSSGASAFFVVLFAVFLTAVFAAFFAVFVVFAMLAICYKRFMRIGVISDTHGLLREEAVDALRGSELIIHAGDVGTAGVLDALREIAPVVAVRGNVDDADDVAALPERE